MRAPDPDGPLPIPNPSTPRLVEPWQRLHGHATSRRWLPEGLSADIDAIRDRHLAQRERLASALNDANAAHAAFGQEDRRYDEALRNAQRTGEPVVDERTPLPERATVHQDLEAVMWAAVEVMAEVVQEAIDTIRKAEPGILAALRSRAAEADERIRRAQAEFTKAQQEHFSLMKLGQWLKNTSDDRGGFGIQPAPTVGPVPPRVSRESVEGALERRWHEQVTA